MTKKDIHIIGDIVPEDFTMTFNYRDKVVGEIKINEKTGMEFHGNLGKSAVIFMDFIKPHIEAWLERKCQKKA